MIPVWVRGFGGNTGVSYGVTGQVVDDGFETGRTEVDADEVVCGFHAVTKGEDRKLEFRNSKQIPNPNIQNNPPGSRLVWGLKQ
jgi:hypothetical protein